MRLRRGEYGRYTLMEGRRALVPHPPLAPAATVTVEVDPAPEVKTFSAERGGNLLGRSFIPADRVSARAWAWFDEATVIAAPPEADASRPTAVTVTGHGSYGAGYRHLLEQAEPFARAVYAPAHTGTATCATSA